MTTKQEYNNLSAIDKQSKTFFEGGSFIWAKSSSDVWVQLDVAIAEKLVSRSRKVNFKVISWAVAASLLLLIGIGSFMRFYSTNVVTVAGQHLMAELPDGSKVHLNAESHISYNPYWWNIQRNLKFEGEGFFEVEKGKKFKVISSNGITEVLGTSFNIFSRENIYKVTCLTGSVKVTSPQKKVAVLKPNSKAIINENGEIEVVKEIETFPEISWRKNIFLFTVSPVRRVFYEIERQYGIIIKTEIDSYPLYTGNFDREQNVEEVLDYVCSALALNFKQLSKGEYLITQNDE